MSEASATPVKRRWWRYSLRTMLLVLTALALWLGMQTDRAIKQRRAVQIVERLGGVVHYHHQLTDDPRRQFDWKREPWAPRWLMDIFGDDYFVAAYEIYVNPAKPSEVQISDEEFAMLCDVTSLRSLCLWRMPISDEDFAHVEKLPYLKTLRLDSRELTDEGLQHVASLRRLENLWLTATPMGPPILKETSRISDAGLAHLSGMSQLRLLDLGGARITDEGLKQLAQHHPCLGELILNNTLVTDAGMATLAKMPHLRIVSLASTDITDAGLKTLAEKLWLECLILTDTNITDEGVASLRDLPKLNHLRLENTSISGAGLKGFTALEYLFLSGTRVTNDEMKHIGQLDKL
jgi:hypothetical protein